MLQELRRSYERQLAMLRELTAAGFAVPQLDERELLDLGGQITAMLPPLVQQTIQMAVSHARYRQRDLRLTLEFALDVRELLSIPWELMVLPLDRNIMGAADTESFLALNADVSLVR